MAKPVKLIQCSCDCEVEKKCQRFTKTPDINVARVIVLNSQMGTEDCPMFLPKEEELIEVKPTKAKSKLVESEKQKVEEQK